MSNHPHTPNVPQVPETANKLNLMGALGDGNPGIDLVAAQEKQKAVALAAEKALNVVGARSYQFPSAPNSFQFNGRKDKTIIPDGIYTTSDPTEIQELEAAVECGNIWPFTGKVFASQQIPPRPINPNETN